MSKVRNGWLDQYGAEPFEQQQLGTAGVEEFRHLAYNMAAVIMTIDRPST